MTDLMQKHNPHSQIESANPWYIDDQVACQLGRRDYRLVVEKRWRIFSAVVEQWLASRGNQRKFPLVVLDAGCGDGVNLIGLSYMFSVRNVPITLYGIDYSPLRASRARSLPSLAGVLQGGLSALPFPDNVFDVVLCNHVLEHLHDDVGAMQELHRVTNEEGLVIVGVPNEGCGIAQLRNRFLQPSIARTTDHVQFYTDTLLEERLAEARFKVIRLEREGFFTPHLRMNVALGKLETGRMFLDFLGQVLPSQCAGLIAIVVPIKV